LDEAWELDGEVCIGLWLKQNMVWLAGLLPLSSRRSHVVRRMANVASRTSSVWRNVAESQGSVYLKQASSDQEYDLLGAPVLGASAESSPS